MTSPRRSIRKGTSDERDIRTDDRRGILGRNSVGRLSSRRGRAGLVARIGQLGLLAREIPNHLPRLMQSMASLSWGGGRAT